MAPARYSESMSADPHAAALDAIARGESADPFAWLGPHSSGDSVVVRVLQPAAAAVAVVRRDTGEVVPATRVREEGLFEAPLGRMPAPPYALRVTWSDGRSAEVDDPYRFGRILDDYDLYLFGEGRCCAPGRSSARSRPTLDGVAGCTSPSGRRTPSA